MEKKNKQEIDRALKSVGLTERIVAHACCGIIFGFLGAFLLFKFNNFWSYAGVATCAIALLTAIFNIVTSITTMNKIKSGNFRHITEPLLNISACSGIIPGRADYLQVNTASFQFYIHKISNVNFQIGDMIDAVFLGTENVPIHVAKVETTEVDDESKIGENQNKGFFTPMIPLILIVLIIGIVALIFPFFK